MGKINRGWLALYLFYGLIFFLLGLGGYLFSNKDMISYLEKYTGDFGEYIGRARESLKDYSLAKDFGLEPESEAIPVSVKQFTPLILYVYPKNLKNNNAALIQEMQTKITANLNNAVAVPLKDHQNWDKKLLNLFYQYESGQRNCILIGFDMLHITGKSHNYKITLIAPEFLTKALTAQLVLPYAEMLPNFTFQNHLYKTVRVSEYFWEEGGVSPEYYMTSPKSLQAIDLLIEILRQNFSTSTKV